MWLLLQYAKKFPKSLRAQLDYVFLQEFKLEDELKEIHKTFASGVIQDFNEFRAAMQIYTSDYGTLVLKLKGSAPNLFYIRALPEDELPPFRLDAGTMFQMAEQHEKPLEKKGNIIDYSNPDIYDYDRARSKKNRSGGGGLSKITSLPNKAFSFRFSKS